MSGLIKSGGAYGDKVRALDLTQLRAAAIIEPDARDLQISAQTARIEALENELAQRDAAAIARSAEIAADLAAAEVRGHSAGLAEADDRATERLSRLELGLSEARCALDEALVGLERLAALLAETALERLVEDPTTRRDLLAAIIRRQVAELQAGALLGVEVSPLDFAEPTALSALVDQAGLSGVRIEVVPGLAVGACRLKLRLGELEVGLDQQWSVLRRLLRDMAAAETPA